MTFSRLSADDQFAVLKRLEVRRERYQRFMKGGHFRERPILIIGDRPGPAAPTDPSYHHTPFYSTVHCSGWMNELLHLSGIKESSLVWVNAYDRLGNPHPLELVQKLRPKHILALGGNAVKWISPLGVTFAAFSHPQYWKRFRSKEPYPLIGWLVNHSGL